MASTGFSRFPLVVDQAAVDRGGGADHPPATCTSRTSSTPTAPSAPNRYPPGALAHSCPSATTTRSRRRWRPCSGSGPPRHVRNAQGRFVGVLFLEDILEELVGEVNDAMQREEHSAVIKS